MPKVKIARKSTWQDMTAMCDVAFLLLTFFILTSNITKKEPAQITTPGSVSESKVAEINVMMILIDKDGKVFFGIDKQKERIEMLRNMGKKYNKKFTPQEENQFAFISNFGVPIERMEQFLKLDPSQRDLKENAVGIPCDSINNQFKNWVKSALDVNPKLQIAIKGDRATQYKVIKQVMGTLQDLRQNRYSLLTGLEEVAEDF